MRRDAATPRHTPSVPEVMGIKFTFSVLKYAAIFIVLFHQSAPGVILSVPHKGCKLMLVGAGSIQRGGWTIGKMAPGVANSRVTRGGIVTSSAVAAAPGAVHAPSRAVVVDASSAASSAAASAPACGVAASAPACCIVASAAARAAPSTTTTPATTAPSAVPSVVAIRVIIFAGWMAHPVFIAATFKAFIVAKVSLCPKSLMSCCGVVAAYMSKICLPPNLHSGRRPSRPTTPNHVDLPSLRRRQYVCMQCHLNSRV
mmetsp:Transcript_29704/g.49185  ORF Transcript_29704/g.49185 Transcript_29704/m.49185 type:complete len:257 (-) Transcript_29704:1724-2494(-)